MVLLLVRDKVVVLLWGRLVAIAIVLGGGEHEFELCNCASCDASKLIRVFVRGGEHMGDQETILWTAVTSDTSTLLPSLPQQSFHSHQHTQAKEQISERSDNISTESTASSHLETNQQGLNTLNTEANKYESELATISSLLDSFIQQNAEAGSEQKKSVAIKVDMEDVKTEIVELSFTKEEKTKAAAASNDELKAADLTLEKATAIVKELEAEKLENDKADVEVLQPALARMDAALKLQETLTAEAADVSKATADHRHTIHKAQTDCDSKVNAVSNELREIKDKAETATCELEELKRVAANEKEAHATELQETKDFAAKLEAATKAEVDVSVVVDSSRNVSCIFTLTIQSSYNLFSVSSLQRMQRPMIV